MEKEAKQIIDLKRNLFKIDVRAQKDEEKVFMRTAWLKSDYGFNPFFVLL
nr:exfoliative toxin [Streptococcus agalactiae]